MLSPAHEVQVFVAASPSPSATCRKTRVLLTEHTATKVSRRRSTNQGFISNLRSSHLCPVPAISSPVSNWSLTYLASEPQCKISFSSMAIEHFNVNVTHAEKHTLSDHKQFHLRIHHDVQITGSVTMYSPLVPPEFITMYSPQDPSRCTHRLPVSAQDEIACCQQHLHSGSCQVPRGKISSVGFCGMLAKSQCFLQDILLHPEPLEFKMLQSCTTLARCGSQCQHPRRTRLLLPPSPRILSKSPGCASCALSPS